MNKRQSNHSIGKDISLTLLSEGKTNRIKAHGYSMYPCIIPGSLILIEPLSIKGLLRPGEIITIRMIVLFLTEKIRLITRSAKM